MIWNMGVLVVGLLSIAAFALAFRFSGLLPRVRAAGDEVKRTVVLMSQGSLDDEEKERLIQLGALRLLRHSALIGLTSIVVLVPPGIVILSGDLVGVAPYTAVSDFLLSWTVMIGASVVIMVAAWLTRYQRRG